jgi:hypothetical protein
MTFFLWIRARRSKSLSPNKKTLTKNKKCCMLSGLSSCCKINFYNHNSMKQAHMRRIKWARKKWKTFELFHKFPRKHSALELNSVNVLVMFHSPTQTNFHVSVGNKQKQAFKWWWPSEQKIKIKFYNIKKISSSSEEIYSHTKRSRKNLLNIEKHARESSSSQHNRIQAELKHKMELMKTIK